VETLPHPIRRDLVVAVASRRGAAAAIADQIARVIGGRLSPQWSIRAPNLADLRVLDDADAVVLGSALAPGALVAAGAQTAQAGPGHPTPRTVAVQRRFDIAAQLTHAAAGPDVPPSGVGRPWVNTYNQYPAGAGFGGYKQSGYGRETDQQTLQNYLEIKNVPVNHDPKPLGFFA